MAKKEEKICEIIPVKKEISSTYFVLDANEFKDSLKNEMALLALERHELTNLRSSATIVTDYQENGEWQMGKSFMDTDLYYILANKSLRERYLQHLNDMFALLSYKVEVEVKDKPYLFYSIPPPTEKKSTGGTWGYYYGGYEPDGSNVRYETRKDMLDKYTTSVPIEYAIRSEKQTTQDVRDEAIEQFRTKIIKMKNVVRSVTSALKDIEEKDKKDKKDDEEFGYDEEEIFKRIKTELCEKVPKHYKDLGNARSNRGYSPMETINRGHERMSFHPRTFWLKKDMGELSTEFPSLAVTAQQNTQFKTYYWPRNAMIGIVGSFIGAENFLILCSSKEVITPATATTSEIDRYVAVYMDLLGNIGIGQVVGDPKSFIKNGNSDESLRSLAERQAMQICFSSFVPVKYDTVVTPNGELEVPKQPQTAKVSFAKRMTINAHTVLKKLPSGVTISDKYIIDPQSGTTIPFISEQKALYLKDALEREYSWNRAVSQIEERPMQMPLITEVTEEEKEDDNGTKMIEEKE